MPTLRDPDRGCVTGAFRFGSRASHARGAAIAALDRRDGPAAPTRAPSRLASRSSVDAWFAESTVRGA